MSSLSHSEVGVLRDALPKEVDPVSTGKQLGVVGCLQFDLAVYRESFNAVYGFEMEAGKESLYGMLNLVGCRTKA